MIMESSEFDAESIDTLTAEKGQHQMHRPADFGNNAAYQSSIFIRIFVAEFNVQKCLQFPPTAAIWEVKQKLFATLPKELKDNLNYGLFCPPYNGRAGKFLDDERTLQDYPLPGHVGYLELKYKRRVYKMMNLDEKALKQLHTKSNLRKFIDHVLNGQVEKITRMCEKGLDPNFHDLDNGETPLTLATTLKEPVPVLVALVSGGAHLDFRALDECTALHRAAQNNNFKALQGLLELGSLANYKDSRGLTPLYYSVTHAHDPNICQALLYDYAHLGTVDNQGWQEIHHACRNGHMRHLEHLIFYGADIDARNASGNTPLHVCAVNNQESCARVLLFRGADKNAKNFANQTAYHMAVIAGAVELAEVIKRHTTKDIVPLREKPNYNPKRRPRSRSPGSIISRTSSVTRMMSRSPSVTNGIAPSPSPSNRSYMVFSTSGSVSSNGSNGENSHPGEEYSTSTSTSTSGVVTDKSSCSDESAASLPSTRRPPPPSHSAHPHPHSYSQSPMSTMTMNTRVSRANDRNDYQYAPSRNTYVQNVRTNGTNSLPDSRSAPRADSAFSESIPVHSRDASPTMSTASSVNGSGRLVGLPRTVTLTRGPGGFGFVLRGSKSGNGNINKDLNAVVGDSPPALQYLDEVDRDGPAHKAGLLAGDFLLSINGEDVRTYPHERAVNLIRHAQHSVTLTVMTPARSLSRHSHGGSVQSRSLTSTLRRGSASSNSMMPPQPKPPARNPTTALSIGPERSKSYIGLNDIGSYDTVTSESVKIASIRPRPLSKRITASEIEDLLARQGSAVQAANPPPLSSFTPAPRTEGSISNGTSRVFTSVAHMKRQRAALQQQRKQTDTVSFNPLRKDFHSTPDLSAEANHTDHESEDIEEIYADTTFGPASVGSHHNLSVEQNHYRTVPAVHPHHQNPEYARPVVNVGAGKPPVQQQPHRHVVQPEIHHQQPQNYRQPMKASVTLDERTYAAYQSQEGHMTMARTTSSKMVYAAPDDPEPDYFSDEDRMSYGSSGRSTLPSTSSISLPSSQQRPLPPPNLKPPPVQNQPAASSSKPPQKMAANIPPPPPPPPSSSSPAAEANSFAAAIAKAAEARKANVSKPKSTSTSSSVTGQPTIKSIPSDSAPQPVIKKDDFQSELAKALQRRSGERDVEAAISEAKRNSTDVDTFNLKDPTENLSTVKDRISFLERQAVLGPRMVRLSGITSDQSSTDDTPNPPATAGQLRDRLVPPFRMSADLDVVQTGIGRKYEQDAVSVHSLSSGSTFSSGYESPTLKYGSTMAGQHAWPQEVPPFRTAKGLDSMMPPPPEFC